ncbi:MULTISPECIES: DUF1269 domain-containing protein [unclassified Ruegeria]|uniref:DUF1269 domain-containing protein n=1 Tax=unclassified Ruegeria TaxID=2625375 RepID=UPI0014895A56|nr:MULTISPECIES: DUF1269 domain-containing protein [unclassified Ruegeria]
MNLVAILMKDVEAARSARGKIAGLTRMALVQLEDAVVVYTEDGEIKLDQTVNMTKFGALGGLWVGVVIGGAIGLMSGNPALLAASGVFGSLTGAVGGSVADRGIPDDFMKKTARSLEDGRAILFLLGGTENPEMVLEKLSAFEGEVLISDFSDDVVQQINDALKSV